MADEYVLRLEAADAGGKAIGFVPDDPQLLEVMQRRGETRIRVAPTDEGDTEGHAFGRTVSVRAILEDDDDTEGHAISLHFPTRDEADAFRRRLLAAGALTGAIAIGSVGAIGLANMPAADTGTGAGQTVVTQAGPMDVHEAPAFQVGAGSAALPDAGMDWTQAERRGATTVTAPTEGMDWSQPERPGAVQVDQSSGASGDRDVRAEWDRTHPATGGGADEADIPGTGLQPR